MQNLAELRAYCLAKPYSQEAFPFNLDVLTFKVKGKIFGLCNLKNEPLRLNLKCEPELAELLRADYPSISPGYHMNKRHWNTLLLDGSIPKEKILLLIDLSYELVVKTLKKSERNQIF